MIVTLAIVILEVNQPFYFTQDDQFVAALPVLLQSSAKPLRRQFSRMEPFSVHGPPAAVLGYGMVLYPPSWLAYAVARYGLGR